MMRRLRYWLAGNLIMLAIMVLPKGPLRYNLATRVSAFVDDIEVEIKRQRQL